MCTLLPPKYLELPFQKSGHYTFQRFYDRVSISFQSGRVFALDFPCRLVITCTLPKYRHSFRLIPARFFTIQRTRQPKVSVSKNPRHRDKSIERTARDKIAIRSLCCLSGNFESGKKESRWKNRETIDAKRGTAHACETELNDREDYSKHGTTIDDIFNISPIFHIGNETKYVWNV